MGFEPYTKPLRTPDVHVGSLHVDRRNSFVLSKSIVVKAGLASGFTLQIDKELGLVGLDKDGPNPYKAAQNGDGRLRLTIVRQALADAGIEVKPGRYFPEWREESPRLVFHFSAKKPAKPSPALDRIEDARIATELPPKREPDAPTNGHPAPKPEAPQPAVVMTSGPAIPQPGPVNDKSLCEMLKYCPRYTGSMDIQTVLAVIVAASRTDDIEIIRAETQVNKFDARYVSEAYAAASAQYKALVRPEAKERYLELLDLKLKGKELVSK